MIPELLHGLPKDLHLLPPSQRLGLLSSYAQVFRAAATTPNLSALVRELLTANGGNVVDRLEIIFLLLKQEKEEYCCMDELQTFMLRMMHEPSDEKNRIEKSQLRFLIANIALWNPDFAFEMVCDDGHDVQLLSIVVSCLYNHDVKLAETFCKRLTEKWGEEQMSVDKWIAISKSSSKTIDRWMQQKRFKDVVQLIASVSEEGDVWNDDLNWKECIAACISDKEKRIRCCARYTFKRWIENCGKNAIDMKGLLCVAETLEDEEEHLLLPLLPKLGPFFASQDSFDWIKGVTDRCLVQSESLAVRLTVSTLILQSLCQRQNNSAFEISLLLSTYSSVICFSAASKSLLLLALGGKALDENIANFVDLMVQATALFLPDHSIVDSVMDICNSSVLIALHIFSRSISSSSNIAMSTITLNIIASSVQSAGGLHQQKLIEYAQVLFSHCRDLDIISPTIFDLLFFIHQIGSSEQQFPRFLAASIEAHFDRWVEAMATWMQATNMKKLDKFSAVAAFLHQIGAKTLISAALEQMTPSNWLLFFGCMTSITRSSIAPNKVFAKMNSETNFDASNFVALRGVLDCEIELEPISNVRTSLDCAFVAVAWMKRTKMQKESTEELADFDQVLTCLSTSNCKNLDVLALPFVLDWSEMISTWNIKLQNILSSFSVPELGSSSSIRVLGRLFVHCCTQNLELELDWYCQSVEQLWQICQRAQDYSFLGNCFLHPNTNIQQDLRRKMFLQVTRMVLSTDDAPSLSLRKYIFASLCCNEFLQYPSFLEDVLPEILDVLQSHDHANHEDTIALSKMDIFDLTPTPKASSPLYLVAAKAKLLRYLQLAATEHQSVIARIVRSLIEIVSSLDLGRTGRSQSALVLRCHSIWQALCCLSLPAATVLSKTELLNLWRLDAPYRKETRHLTEIFMSIVFSNGFVDTTIGEFLLPSLHESNASPSRAASIVTIAALVLLEIHESYWDLRSRILDRLCLWVAHPHNYIRTVVHVILKKFQDFDHAKLGTLVEFLENNSDSKRIGSKIEKHFALPPRELISVKSVFSVAIVDSGVVDIQDTAWTIEKEVDDLYRQAAKQYQEKAENSNATACNIVDQIYQRKIQNTQFSAPQFQGIVVASLLQKPVNIAGLVRTCEVFGLSQLVVDNVAKLKATAEYKSMAVSAGQWLPLEQVVPDDVVAFLHAKKQQGYTVVALEQTSHSIMLGNSNITFPNRSVLVLGNERNGIPLHVLQNVDCCIEIPQFGMIRSLNVHVSASLLVWEYVKAQGQKREE